LGFIGVGTMGRGHVGRFLGMGDVQVVAISDVVIERANAAKEQVEQKYAEATKSGAYKDVRLTTISASCSLGRISTRW
jgi:predicted homoserine dehydrogenase-like protein